MTSLPAPNRQRHADRPEFYDDIEAYTGQLSYRAGDTASLHVSCLTNTFSVTVERWGANRVVVWSADECRGEFQAVPSTASAQGCGWAPTLEIPIGEDWQSGFYLVTCTATGADPRYQTGHAGFVVRPAADAPQRERLLVLATNTWNAYNPWGGASLYTGGDIVSFRRPLARGFLARPELDRDDRKARPQRWGEQPDFDGTIYTDWRHREGYVAGVGSASWFMYERRFVEWAEQHGYEFDFAISSDLDQDFSATSSALDGYHQVLSVGHDEYWSARQRRAVERFIETGGNFSSMSGNTMFWQVRLEGNGQPASDPRSQMIGYKYTAHTNDPVIGTEREGEMTGMWADPLVGQPETALLGGGSAWGLYSRWGRAVKAGSGAFTVYRDDHWLLADTGLGYGDLLGARDQVVGYETLGCRLQFDKFQLPVAAGGDGTPAAIEVIAFTPSSNLGVGDYPASISALSDQGDLEFLIDRLDGQDTAANRLKRRIGNAVMVVCYPFGRDAGEVVTIGTTDWVYGLANDSQVAQVTHNLLRRP